jgi:hypothetical protein
MNSSRHIPSTKPKPDKMRTCLRCDKDFPSTGVGNRICVKCSHINSQTSVKSSLRDMPQRAVKLPSH